MKWCGSFRSMLGILVILVILSTGLWLGRLPRAHALSSFSPTPSAISTTAAEKDVHFVHVATAKNIIGNSTYLDHPLLNGNSNAVFVVTPNWNPSWTRGKYFDKPFGVWFDSVRGRWAIFTQDRSAMPEGVKFNVLIPGNATTAFVHKVTGANRGNHVTYLNHAALNNRPDALFLVTPNWNPGGSLRGVYTPHHIGVWYNNFSRRWSIFNQDLQTMPLNAAFNVVVVSGRKAAFKHVATPENTIGHRTWLNSPMLRKDPDALVYITSNYQGVYNNHATGVWYNGNTWEIFNQDRGRMQHNTAFNVYVAPQSQSAFSHAAGSRNIFYNYTLLDHSLLNDNPNAIVFVTQKKTMDTIEHPLGVWYTSYYRRWSIFQQDRLRMKSGSTFHVFVPPPSLRVFVHTATAANSTSNMTWLDHPMLNNNPNAIVLVTQNWNPGGRGGKYNNQNIGVYYDGVREQWAIFNQDKTTAIPNGASFNVFVANRLGNAFVHRAGAGNIIGGTTFIDHPRLNGNPGAVLIVTPNRNPDGEQPGVYNNHNIVVWYWSALGKWGISNQNGTPIPNRAAFNVLIVTNETFLPLMSK